MASGALWNTLILACNAGFLWSQGRRRFPETIHLLERFAPVIGTADEDAALDRLYQDLPVHDFSSELLEPMPHQIAVLELNDIIGLTGAGWSALRRLCGREVSDRRSHLNAKLFDDSKKLPSSQREEGKAEGMPSAGWGNQFLEREARPFRQRQQPRRGVRKTLQITSHCCP